VTTEPANLPIPLQRPPAPQRGFAVLTRLSPPARDDVPLASVQGTLALDLEELPTQLSAPPEPGHLALAPSPDQAADEVKAWARRFAQAVVEVAGGDRPVTQLLRWTTPRVYQDLTRRVQIMAQTRSAPERLRTIRPQVLSVHVFQPKPSSVEVSVHVRYGLRSRALAARMERRRGAWTCTDLQLG
jgi:hypothetical protein